MTFDGHDVALMVVAALGAVVTLRNGKKTDKAIEKLDTASVERREGTQAQVATAAKVEEVAKIQVATAEHTDGQLKEIHTLTNSTLTAANKRIDELEKLVTQFLESNVGAHGVREDAKKAMKVQNDSNNP